MVWGWRDNSFKAILTAFRRTLGTLAALLFSQLVYWHRRSVTLIVMVSAMNILWRSWLVILISVSQPLRKCPARQSSRRDLWIVQGSARVSLSSKEARRARSGQHSDNLPGDEPACCGTHDRYVHVAANCQTAPSSVLIDMMTDEVNDDCRPVRQLSLSEASRVL